VVVPEVRKIIGLKNEPNKIEVLIPTESIPPTPTNGPCVDILDVRFISDPIFSKEALTDYEPIPPSGQYILVATEIKNLQSQGMSFEWDQAFEIAGLHNANNNNYTYYAPNWNVTWNYADENALVENCTSTLNPGIWNSCYMVFDIDPTIDNLYLVLHNLETESGQPFNNACKTSWKIPDSGQ